MAYPGAVSKPVAIAVGAVLVACAACRSGASRAAASESPDPFVRMAEIERARQRVLDEIERLGSVHPWAGVYHRNGAVPCSLAMSPDAGAVRTLFGCFGLHDSEWSHADATLVPAQCAFSSTNVRAHVVAFGASFELVSEHGKRILRGDDGSEYALQPPDAARLERMR